MNTHQAELEAIQQAIAIDENHLKAAYEANKDHISFEDYYDIPYLVEKLNSSDINKVVLQFTNEILVDSVKVKDLLEAKTGKKIFILSDSAKTGCCVDMVGARHINPDFVVHFGDACLSDRTIHNIQVDYVFPKLKVDLEELKAQIGAVKAEGKITKDLIVIVDVMYNYKNEEIYKTIAKELEGVNVVQTVIPRDLSRLAAEYEHVTFGRYIKKEQASFLGQKKDLLVVGPAESNIIDNLRLSKDIFNIDKVFVCDPYSSCEVSEFNDSSKILMKRYFMIEKAKEVDIFGILINKANLDKYKDILERTKTILKQNNKKFYFFIINKLTEPKLGNFPEIGAYINIACPYSTFYDIKDFYKIMINPFELEYAVAGSAWKNYILNDVSNIISQEIPKGAEPVQKEEEERKQEVDTGKDQQLSKVEGQGQLIKLDFLKSLDFHKDRTYKGLDLGVEREVQLAIKGRSGLAREYDDEPHV